MADRDGRPKTKRKGFISPKDDGAKSDVRQTRVLNAALRFPRRMLVRMTEEERRTLGKRAHAAYLSLSRYLVQTAMEGKAPPTQAEREQLERLLFLLKRAATILTQLLGNARALRLMGADKEMEGYLENAVDLMTRLCNELKRRL
jgi:hypothetical protein